MMMACFPLNKMPESRPPALFIWDSLLLVLPTSFSDNQI